MRGFNWYTDPPILVATLAVLLYLAWLSFFFAVEAGPLAALLPVVGLAVAVVVTTVVHELGHLVVGWLVGFRLEQLNLCGLVFDLDTGGVRLWSPALGGEWIGYVGFGLPAGARPTNGLRWSLAAFVAAGPVANFLFAVACVAAAHLLQPETDLSGPACLRGSWAYPLLFPGSFWVALCGILAAGGLWLGGLSLLPVRLESGPSDGEMLRGCVLGGPGALRYLATQWVRDALASGVRPLDWDRDWADQLAGRRDDSVERITADLHRYYYEEDHGRTEEAGKLLDSLLDGWKGHPLRLAILLESAYFAGHHRGDPKAAAVLGRLTRAGIEEHTWLRAEAAVRGAEGKFDEAIALIDRALAAVPRSVDPGGAIAERDWLGRMRERYLARRAESAGREGFTAGSSS